MPDEEPPIREQLVAAREKIIAQIDEMMFRASPSANPSRDSGPPAYGDLVAELQEQLREIDALLSGTDLLEG